MDEVVAEILEELRHSPTKECRFCPSFYRTREGYHIEIDFPPGESCRIFWAGDTLKEARDFEQRLREALLSRGVSPTQTFTEDEHD